MALPPHSHKHPMYADMVTKWERCRDCIEGTDAVKGKTTKYLPKLEGQSKADYEAYLTRALFVGVGARTLGGLVGLVTRRAPEVTAPDAMKPYFEDTDNRGTSFDELFRYLTTEVMLTGRIGLLVDYSKGGGRPYIVPYRAENILNWNWDSDSRQLNMLVLHESIYIPSTTDVFDIKLNHQYRALRVENGAYQGQVWRETNATGTSTKTEMVDAYVPSIRGTPINFIPFTFITPAGISYELHKPPMIDIVDVNLSHYRTSADLEHGRHFTALPVPVVTGVESDEPLRIGSQTAWVLPPADAKAYYLEFEGQGLLSLEKALGEKISQMAIFSTRLMDTSTRGSEAADTVRLRHASDAATLTTIAEAIESGLNRVYRMIAQFEGIEGEVNIKLNKHFLDTRLPAAELREIVKAFVDGAIDDRTLIYNLSRGDIMPPEELGNA